MQKKKLIFSNMIIINLGTIKVIFIVIKKFNIFIFFLLHRNVIWGHGMIGNIFSPLRDRKIIWLFCHSRRIFPFCWRHQRVILWPGNIYGPIWHFLYFYISWRSDIIEQIAHITNIIARLWQILWYSEVT